MNRKEIKPASPQDTRFGSPMDRAEPLPSHVNPIKCRPNSKSNFKTLTLKSLHFLTIIRRDEQTSTSGSIPSTICFFLWISAKMRPILMKGHERPLTFLKYNRDGDLLFSCAKDHNPTVWFADNGERLGTYRGHNGAVWCCDVSSMLHLLLLIFFFTSCSFGLGNWGIWDSFSYDAA